MLAQRETRVGQLLDRNRAQVVEPSDLTGGSRHFADVDERRSAPEVERLGQLRDGGCGITHADRVTREQHESFEALRVELVGLDPEHVSVRTGRQSGTRRARTPVELEDLTDTADMNAQRGRGAGGWVALPQLFDELFGRDRPVGPHRQECEQLPGLFAADLHGRSIVPHLDRSEDSQLHVGPHMQRSGNGTSAPARCPWAFT